MASMYQRIQDLKKGSTRPSGTGEVDPITGMPKAARTKTGPEALGGYMYNTMLQGENNATQAPYESNAKVNQAYVRSPQEQAAAQLEQENSSREKRRTRGRASTLLTGSSGLLSTPNVSRRSLMGY